MKNTDTIINARWVIPVDDSNNILDNHSIVVESGKILQVLPTSEANSKYEASQRVTLSDHHALVPGFVNSHAHASMSLFRGIAEDVPLEAWLQEHIWPLEGKWADQEFVRDGAMLAFAEAIKSGTTCINDMYFFPEQVGEVAESVNMRVCLGMIVLEFPTRWAQSAQEYLENGLDLHQQFGDSELVSTILAPHAPYTVFDPTFESILKISEDHDLGVHMHVHETAQEVTDSLKQYGVRPLQRLNNLGLVNRNLVAVHATQLLDDEIALLSESKSSVVHCPKSNLKISSGICPVSDLLNMNVNVSIGTDGAASNNSLNMLEEMRFASLVAKGVSGNPANVSVHQALRMSTINGAKSLGMDHLFGSLEKGKLADITAIDLGALESRPVYNPVSQIVHSAARNQVTDVWIGGSRVLDSGKLTFIDDAECVKLANQWHARISSDIELSHG